VLLKELSNRTALVAIVWNAANPYSLLVFRATKDAAQPLNVQLQSHEVIDTNHGNCGVGHGVLLVFAPS
jgi:hypothetical protein